jgi:hypothetical protein
VWLQTKRMELICDQFSVSHRHGVRSPGLNIEKSQKVEKEDTSAKVYCILLSNSSNRNMVKHLHYPCFVLI